MKDFTIVTGCTPDYMKKLMISLPSWVIKPQFQNKKLIIFYNGFKRPGREFSFVRKYFKEFELIEWNMKEGNIREKMLSSFILGVDNIKTDHFVKIDADTFFINKKDVFIDSDFDYDIVSHSWSYTKPGWWKYALDNFFYKKNDLIDTDLARYDCPRIQSICCLHKTEFVKEVKNMCGERLPVPSHDTVLWYLANEMKDRKWLGRNLKKAGISHVKREKSMRDEICANIIGSDNQYYKENLLNNVQLEVTSFCQLGCNNCDRNCGTFKTDEFMSIAQIWKFVEESIKLNKNWNRIDIIGGEPTYYPKFEQLFQILEIYRNKFPKCKFRFSTNGLGSKVEEKLKLIPNWVEIRNSNKKSKVQSFEAYNSAPIDNGEKGVKACSIPWRCGIGLTKYGYFPCGAGASLCKVFGLNIGIKNLKEVTPEKIYEQMKQICKLCGHSMCKSRHLITDTEISPSWQKAFDNVLDNILKMKEF